MSRYEYSWVGMKVKIFWLTRGKLKLQGEWNTPPHPILPYMANSAWPYMAMIAFALPNMAILIKVHFH